MRILEIIPSLQAGGAETFIVNLSNQIVNSTINECIVATMYDGDETEFLRKRLSNKIKTLGFKKKSGLDILCMFRILRYIYKYAPDIVHVHSRAIPYILLSSIFCYRVKFFATIHSEASREAGSGFNKLARAILFKLKLCTPVTISNESLQSFRKLYKIDAPMIINGSTEYIISTMDNPFKDIKGKIFVNIASFQSSKNQIMLVNVFRRLLADGEDVNLFLIGRNGVDTQYDNLLFCSISENPQIKYLGEVTNPRDYMRYADGFCLSSKMEGMPISIIEAFSVGCIPLCTPVGGCINMINNGENGFLSKDVSEDSYYKMMKLFLALPKEDTKKMSNKSKQSFEQYNIKTTANKYLNLFQQ